jgi:hypothetical protein
MRRTFAEPKSEQLTDGTHRALPESWFYMVRQEVLWSGNREIVLEEDDPSHPAAAADATVPRATFAALEGLLEAQETGPEVLDSNVQKRLRALGYTR